MSQKIIEASTLADRGRPWDGVKLLIESVRPIPRRQGAGDALALMTKIYYQTNQNHYGEVAGLEALRLAPSLINADLLFETLVNLNCFNLNLKSYEDAYTYGLMAERIHPGDSDLEANQVVAAAAIGRGEEALARFGRLQQLAPMKAAEIGSILRKDPGLVLTSTRDLDCFDILQRLRAAVTVTAGRADDLVRAVLDLERRPEGVGSRDCWFELCRFYRQTIEIAEENEYLLMQSYAGLASATGKALTAARTEAEAESDRLLWSWRGEAFKQLRLFDLATPALERARALAPSDSTISEALSECRVMADLRLRTADRPEDFLPVARSLARQPATFWKAFDLFQEGFFLSKRPLEERVRQSEELHNRGFALFHADKTEAIGLLCEAAANHPEVSHSWQELGSLYSSLNRFREAELFQRYAVELVRSTPPLPPDAGRFWANLANCRYNRALSEETLSAARRDLKLREAMADARQAIDLGDHRAQTILRRILDVSI